MSILRALERRGAPGNAPWGDSTPPPPSAGSGAVAGTNITEQTALQIAAVYGSVSVIADSVSSLPVDLMSSPHRRSGTTLPPSPLLEQPYAEISPQDWWVQFTTSLALRGNFYGQIISRDRKTAFPTQIKPIHPDHARVRRLADGSVEYRFNGQRVPLANVFHVRFLSVAESLVGLNPIEYLRNVFGLARAADLYGGAFFQNSAMPSITLEVDDDLDEDEARALKQQWSGMHQGIGQAQLPAVLTGGVKANPISITPEDAQFLESRQLSASTISGQIFRVPPHMVGIVDRTTSWGCLPADALVFTTSGPTPIVDVAVGEEVWSLDADGMRRATVTGRAMNGYKPLLSIETTGRTLRCTANHHVPVRRYNAGQGAGKCGWDDVLVDASDVRVGDFLMVPHGFGDVDGQTTAPNGRKLTVEAMEFCGLYLGDGSMDKNRMEIAHETEPAHMAYYSRAIAGEFDVTPYVDKRGYRTRFSSAEARELLECGFTGTALTKRLPRWTFELAPDLQLALLRGYLDADGSVQRGRIIYSSANRDLLEDVRHLCIQLGIPTGRVCFGRAGGVGVIRGREHVSHPKWQLALSSLPFNSRIGSNSPRKMSRFVDTPHKRVGRYDDGWMGVANRRPQDRRQSPGYGWSREGVRLQRVTRIVQGKTAVAVYDLEVKGPATFVADGVCVGNSGIEQQELGFVRNTLVGYLSRGERAMTAVHPPGQFVKFDLSDRLRGDRLQRYQAYALGVAGGWMVPDEARAEEDMAPLPGGIGKTAMAPINAQSLKQMAQESIQSVQQQQQQPPGQGGDNPGDTGGNQQ